VLWVSVVLTPACWTVASLVSVAALADSTCCLLLARLLSGLCREIYRYPNAELLWCQEEPMNMGAYFHIQVWRRVVKVRVLCSSSSSSSSS